ncbi:MAG: Rnase Y domain-containing protein, partial [Bacteroidetes bacterium]|nr:Rnase Y domain-containing protein [Bacteroidota bacterium]
MPNILLFVIIGVSGIIIGGLITGTILNKALERKRDALLKEAMDKAEVIKKDKILQAKEKFLQLKTEHEKFVHEKNEEVAKNENRLKQKEGTINQKIEELAKKQKEIVTIKQSLQTQVDIVSKKQIDLDKAQKVQIEKLESISNLSAQEAKTQLIENLKEEAKADALVHIKDIVDEAKITANTEAKKIIIETIQRTATEHAIENTVSVFNIESEEIKGRIIGREGRNIRTLESLTGVEIIIDDSPDAILLSGFDPVRREIARLSLHKLVTDGRIHPARIEEVVAK